LLAVKGAGPTVVGRLEQQGIDSLAVLVRLNAASVCADVSAMVGGTCWRNAPRARASARQWQGGGLPALRRGAEGEAASCLERSHRWLASGGDDARDA